MVYGLIWIRLEGALEAEMEKYHLGTRLDVQLLVLEWSTREVRRAHGKGLVRSQLLVER